MPIPEEASGSGHLGNLDSNSFYFSNNLKSDSSNQTYPIFPPSFGRGNSANPDYSSYSSERRPISASLTSVGGTGGARNFYKMLVQ